MRLISFIWDRSVSKGTDQSHRGQISLIWDRAVSWRTEKFHMGQSSFIWDREHSYGKEQSLIWDEGQKSFISDRAVLCGTDFLWFLKDSWIARKSKIIFQNFDKFWNVWPASKYFSMISKRLLDCQNVQDNFPEVWQVLVCLSSFKIFFYDF